MYLFYFQKIKTSLYNLKSSFLWFYEKRIQIVYIVMAAIQNLTQTRMSFILNSKVILDVKFKLKRFREKTESVN